jgi:predicted dehydrogenase
MIRYGLVGVGGYASVWVRWLEALRQRGVACIGAVVVRRPERYGEELARLAAQGCAVYPALDALLADEGIDIIGLPTGIATHAPLAGQALDAGYPVLVEKPLAATVQEAWAVQEAEARSGRWCAVAYQWLHSPTIQALAGLLARGELGRVREARCVIGWPRGAGYYRRNAWAGQLKSPQGWVLDGPATNATAHYLTNLLYLAGVQPQRPAIAAVRAELYRANAIPSYDTSCIEIQLSDGARLYHYASHAVQESIEPQMQIQCERGAIWWEAATDTATVTLADGSRRTIANPDPASNQGRPLEQAARVVAGVEAQPLCGVGEALPHVLTVNLAFESSGGVRGIEARTRQVEADGEPLVVADGMDALLRRGMAEGGLFSDLGATWARATAPCSAGGYGPFPQSDALRHFLAG